jgi:hypothetical protein
MMTFAHMAAQYTRAPRSLHSPVVHVSLHLLFSSCAHLRQKSISLNNISYLYFTKASVIIQLQLAFCFFHQANYINALAVSVLPFFEPAMPMTLVGLCVTLGGFWYDIG